MWYCLGWLAQYREKSQESFKLCFKAWNFHFAANTNFFSICFPFESILTYQWARKRRLRQPQTFNEGFNVFGSGSTRNERFLKASFQHLLNGTLHVPVLVHILFLLRLLHSHKKSISSFILFQLSKKVWEKIILCQGYTLLL